MSKLFLESIESEWPQWSRLADEGPQREGIGDTNDVGYWDQWRLWRKQLRGGIGTIHQTDIQHYPIDEDK